MPCSGTASTRIAIATRAEIDWYNPFCFGEREERVSHQILCISGREIAGQRPKELQLVALGMVSTPHGHCSHAAISDVPGPHTGAEPDAFSPAARSPSRDRTSTFWRRDRPKLSDRLRRTRHVRRSSDTSARCRTCGASRACDRRDQVTRGFRCTQEARGQSGHGIGHFRTPG